MPKVRPLFECAGVWKWMDRGFVDVSAGAETAGAFVAKCGGLRFRDREGLKQD